MMKMQPIHLALQKEKGQDCKLTEGEILFASLVGPKRTSGNRL